MSATLPESVDAWRMVSARRSFQGSLPIAAMPRLCEALAGDAGSAQYQLDFGRDEFGTAYIEVRVQAPLWLVCQRTLDPFVMPITVDTRVGLIRSEREEAALPAGYEPLLVDEDDKLNPIDVIEDELLLALPLVPVNPDSAMPEEATRPPTEAIPAEERPDNPFAVLRELKSK
ncbi:YceD family protein [Dyella nitratireducens]